MVQIKNKRKLKWALINYKKRKIKQVFAARYLGITARRFRQIYVAFETSGEVPLIGVDLGRPKKETPEEWKDIIDELYKEYKN